MADFGAMADKAKDFAGEHDKQSDEALDKAADVAGDKTGGKYDSQIQTRRGEGRELPRCPGPGPEQVAPTCTARAPFSEAFCVSVRSG
jgi:hypothetical protein